MSTVAYPARRPVPHWWQTAGDLATGSRLAAACLAGVHSAGWLLGLIGSGRRVRFKTR
jgi:hypothetical protein